MTGHLCSRVDSLVWSFFGQIRGCLLLWLLLATPTSSQTIPRHWVSDSMKTLIHAFVMSCVNYCNAVLAGSPRCITDKLQHLLNAAAYLVTATWKFDHGLSCLLHDELHWLDILEPVHYKLRVTVHWCLCEKAPKYLVDYCTPVSNIVSWRHLFFFSRHHLTVPRHRLSTLCRRSDGQELTTRH